MEVILINNVLLRTKLHQTEDGENLITELSKFESVKIY